MAKKKTQHISNNTAESNVKVNSKEITLLEFLEKQKISSFLRKAYLSKFSANDKMLEKDWLKK